MPGLGGQLAPGFLSAPQGVLAAGRPVGCARGRNRAPARAARFDARVKLAALAAAVALLFWSAAYLAHRPASGKAYATAVGGRQVVRLA